MNISQDTIESLGHSCLLLHCSQHPSFGNSLDALQLLNELGKYNIYIHNGVLFSHKEE
jgi:hypothetical protein